MLVTVSGEYGAKENQEADERCRFAVICGVRTKDQKPKDSSQRYRRISPSQSVDELRKDLEKN